MIWRQFWLRLGTRRVPQPQSYWLQHTAVLLKQPYYPAETQVLRDWDGTLWEETRLSARQGYQPRDGCPVLWSHLAFEASCKY